MDWKEFVLNLAIQSSIWQCLSGGARREIERPFLETKRILAGTGSVLVRPALCLSRLPRVWGLRGPSPAWPQVGTKESRDRSWTQPDTGERESLTQHVLTSAGPRQQLASFLEIIQSASARSQFGRYLSCQGGQVSGFLPRPVNNADSKVRGNTK